MVERQLAGTRRDDGYELLDRVSPTSITRRIATPNLPYSGSWTFSLKPNGELTTVCITENGEVRNPVFRLISAILGHTAAMDAYLRAPAVATKQQVEIKIS